MGLTHAKARVWKTPAIEKSGVAMDTSVVVASVMAVSLYNVAFEIAVAVGV